MTAADERCGSRHRQSAEEAYQEESRDPPRGSTESSSGEAGGAVGAMPQGSFPPMEGSFKGSEESTDHDGCSHGCTFSWAHTCANTCMPCAWIANRCSGVGPCRRVCGVNIMHHTCINWTRRHGPTPLHLIAIHARVNRCGGNFVWCAATLRCTPRWSCGRGTRRTSGNIKRPDAGKRFFGGRPAVRKVIFFIYFYLFIIYAIIWVIRPLRHGGPA